MGSEVGKGISWHLIPLFVGHSGDLVNAGIRDVEGAVMAVKLRMHMGDPIL